MPLFDPAIFDISIFDTSPDTHFIDSPNGPYLGRNARFYVDGVVVAYAKNIAFKISAELIKEYSIELADPVIVASGKQTIGWSCDRLFTVDGAWLTKLKSGTVFTVVFAVQGTLTSVYETLNYAFISDFEVSASESGAVQQKISGEAESITPY